MEGGSFMKVRVRLFGPAADFAGMTQTTIDMPPEATVGMVKEAVLDLFPRLREFEKGIAVAVDKRYASPDLNINEDSEVVIIPPVGGG